MGDCPLAACRAKDVGVRNDGGSPDLHNEIRRDCLPLQERTASVMDALLMPVAKDNRAAETERVLERDEATQAQGRRTGATEKSMSGSTANEAVVRNVISSFGFPEERVERALACLLSKNGEALPEVPVERVLSFREVCKVLSLSKSGLRRIINAGELTPVRLSERRIGFRVQDVNAFVETRRQGG